MLNDAFRRNCGMEVYDVIWQPTLYSRKDELHDPILAEIRACENFNDDEGPSVLHDFGTIVVAGEIFRWSILYFLLDGSEPNRLIDAEIRRMFIEP
jgi:hypothetical protein